MGEMEKLGRGMELRRGHGEADGSVPGEGEPGGPVLRAMYLWALM